MPFINKPCGFSSYFLNFNKGSYQQERVNYFPQNNDNIPSQVVTKSALTQARKHLSHTAFTALNRQVIDAYYGHHNGVDIDFVRLMVRKCGYPMSRILSMNLVLIIKNKKYGHAMPGYLTR